MAKFKNTIWSDFLAMSKLLVETSSGSGLIASKAKLAFIKLRKTLIEASLFYYFDPQCHIWVKIHIFGYPIGRVLSYLTLDNLNWWYLLIFFFEKMILVETWYKNSQWETSGNFQVFKTYYHYLKSCKHEILIFTNHNNSCHFMNIKTINSKQVQWA